MSNQLTLGDNYRVEPPECYEYIEQNIIAAIDNGFGKMLDQFTPEGLADDMNEQSGIYQEYKRQDVIKSIRIYRERQGIEQC